MAKNVTKSEKDTIKATNQSYVDLAKTYGVLANVIRKIKLGRPVKLK